MTTIRIADRTMTVQSIEGNEEVPESVIFSQEFMIRYAQEMKEMKQDALIALMNR